jgi:hypothetical protein
MHLDNKRNITPYNPAIQPLVQPMIETPKQLGRSGYLALEVGKPLDMGVLSLWTGST